jgi:sulfite exporter TauE/SafE
MTGAQQTTDRKDDEQMGRVTSTSSRWDDLWFHLMLNLGRLLSYAVVGAFLGWVGGMVVWSGQLAGVGSTLRRAIALITGFLLIWFGVRQTWPTLLPRMPLSILTQTRLHQVIEHVMKCVGSSTHLLKAMALGMVWGLMPCGFLFAAQLKAFGESDPLSSALIMFSFGLGTLPSMVGVGVTSAFLSHDHRSQLFRAGGVVAIAIGVLTVVRTGDLMVDYAAYGGLMCLMLALVARPISHVWPALLKYRRALGVGGFVLSVAHVIHRIEHTWGWQLDAVMFMPRDHQQGMAIGVMSLLLLVPLALTSFDGAQRYLGSRWRKLHLLSIPALVLATGHAIMVGSNFLGSFQLTWLNYALTGVLLFLVISIFLVRSPGFWSLLSIQTLYVLPHRSSAPSNMASASSESSDAQCHDISNVSGDRESECGSSNRNVS